MGLDNGFYVVSKKRDISREDLPNIIHYPFEKDYSDKVEIVYWRKCWGLRNGVMDILGKRLSEEIYYEIDSTKQVQEIIELIASFLDKDRWEYEGDSIWEFDEIKNTLIQNIINLATIMQYMKQNPDVYLIFYDSY